jgi:N-acetylmuramoyl-L-alanine amidase
MRKLENIIIHHSASHFGDVETFRDWHIKRGWRDVAYNIIVLNGMRTPANYNEKEDGLIEYGRGLDFDKVIDSSERGAHALGYNSTSIGICLVGSGEFTKNQFYSLELFCKLWKRIIPGLKIKGHGEVNSTSCPGFDVQEWLKKIKI